MILAEVVQGVKHTVTNASGRRLYSGRKPNERKAVSQSVYNSAISRYYALHMEDLKRAQHENQAHLHTGVYAACNFSIDSVCHIKPSRAETHLHFKRSVR